MSIIWKIHVAFASWITENEYCKTTNDLKESLILSKIINIISQKCWDIINKKWECIWENINDSIEKTFTMFILNKPITIDEQQLLLWFLNDKKAFKIANSIFSKLNLLQWDSNKFLFDIYLKDSEWNFDITNFIEYLKYYIENYSLILKNDISDVNHLNEVNGTFYYRYNFNNNYNSVFVIKNWEIIYLDKPLSEIQILDNWLIFWVELNSDDSNLEEFKEWVLYEFDWSKFIKIYSKPWLDWLEQTWNIEWFDDLFISKSEWREWLMEISKSNQSELPLYNINEVIPPINNKVICHSNWFITTQNKEILEWKEQYRNKTYSVLPDSYKWPIYLNRMKVINDILSNDKTFILKNLWDDFFIIALNELSNIYKFYKDFLGFNQIDWLQWIFSKNLWYYSRYFIDKDQLLNWLLTEIKYSNWEAQILVFDKQTLKVTTLIIIKNLKFDSFISKDRLKIRLNDGNNIYYYYNDWKFYWLKKKNKYLIFLREMLWQNVSLGNSYEEMKEYLEEVNFPVIIN